jgi:hypothetical protein
MLIALVTAYGLGVADGLAGSSTRPGEAIVSQVRRRGPTGVP